MKSSGSSHGLTQNDLQGRAIWYEAEQAGKLDNDGDAFLRLGASELGWAALARKIRRETDRLPRYVEGGVVTGAGSILPPIGPSGDGGSS